VVHLGISEGRGGGYNSVAPLRSSAVKQTCREAMSGYGSSISEDKAALKSAEAGSKQEKALRVLANNCPHLPKL